MTILFLILTKSFIAQPLSGILPKDNSIESVNNPYFQWNELVSAIHYSVLLSQDSTFNSGVIQSPLLYQTSWISSSLDLGIWFWKIIALTSNGLQSSNIYSFNVYSPSQNQNLSLWLKADSGLVMDGIGNVQTWMDLSSNEYTFTQPVALKRPGIELGSINSFPTLSFNGSHFLNGGDILDIGNSSRSMFIVAKMAASNQAVFAKSLANNASNRYSLIKDGNSTALIFQSNTAQHIYSTYNSVDYALYSIVSSRLIGKNRFEVNNEYLGQSNVSPLNNMNSTFRFLIGAYNNSDDTGELLLLNGNISEIIFINSADSLENLKAENYLRYKYSPPLNLGSDIISNDFCPVQLTAPSNFTNLLWSTGETTSTITVDPGGQYWLQGTDRFGYVSSDTIQINCPLIPSPPDSFICFNTIEFWNASVGIGYSYLWNTGSTSSIISVSLLGSYFVEVTDSMGCIKNSDTINFSIDNYSQTAFLGNDTILCVGNLLTLQIGALNTMSYLWPDGSSNAFYAIDTAGNYFVQTVNVNGCIANDTINISIAGQAPLADFSYQNQCLNLPNSFGDLSVGIPTDTVVFWQWNFGDGQTSTDQNPSHVYSSAGNYTVQLYILSNGGCGAFQTQTLSVFAPPQANFSYSGLCSKNTTELNDLSLLGDEDLETYQWDFGQPGLGANNYSSDQNPTVFFPNAGTFTFSLTVLDSNSCGSDTSFSVTVNPSPTVDFTIAAACVGQPSAIVNNSIVNSPATYLWDFGDGTSSSLATPVKSYTQYGNQDVSLTITSANGCVSDSVVSVAIHPYPVPFIEMGPACVGTYLVLKDTSSIPQGSIANVTWILNLTDTLYGDSVNYLVSTFDQQQVKMIVESAEGCASTVSKFFTATTELDAAFTVPSSIVAEGIPIPFSNTSVGGTSYAWDFGDGNSSALPSPNHIFGENWIDSQLQVQLIATNTIGCRDTTYQIVQVKSRLNDLVLGNLFYQKTGNLAVVGVEIKNEGSAPFSHVDLFLSSEKGPLFQETWNGTLQPNEHFIYLFQSKPVYNPTSADELTAFYCVEGSIAELESIYENNRVCKNTENSEVILLPVYPNPASNVLELNLLVAENSTISIDMIDERGRKILDFYQDASLTSGLYKTSQDIRRVEAGCYFIRMTANDAETMQRVLIVR